MGLHSGLLAGLNDGPAGGEVAGLLLINLDHRDEYAFGHAELSALGLGRHASRYRGPEVTSTMVASPASRTCEPRSSVMLSTTP